MSNGTKRGRSLVFAYLSDMFGKGEERKASGESAPLVCMHQASSIMWCFFVFLGRGLLCVFVCIYHFLSVFPVSPNSVLGFASFIRRLVDNDWSCSLLFLTKKATGVREHFGVGERHQAFFVFLDQYHYYHAVSYVLSILG